MTTLASAAGGSVVAGVVAVYAFIGVSSDNAALRGGGCPRCSTTGCREGRGVVPRQLYLPVGVNQFCRFTSSAWPRCWAALVR